MKSIISFALVIIVSFFLNVSYCLADEIGSELNNNSKETKYKVAETDINNNDDIPKASNEDIFGDEQAFPFIAGLGKNAAH